MPMHIRRGYEKSFNDFMIARLITLMAELLLVLNCAFVILPQRKRNTQRYAEELCVSLRISFSLR